VLTLPATSGTVVTTATSTGISGSAITTGTVGVSVGGTGQTTAAAAFNALNPMTTVGDIIYEGTGPAAARLGIGTEGQVLSVASGIPAWATVSSSPTTAQVLSATAGASAGDVGTYGFLGGRGSQSVNWTANSNYAGSLLCFTGIYLTGNSSWAQTGTTTTNVVGGFGGSALSGTWKAMGQCSGGFQQAMVFLRVS
jgi:hypothetical protein